MRITPSSGTLRPIYDATGCSTTGSSEAVMLAAWPSSGAGGSAGSGRHTNRPTEPGDGRQCSGPPGEVLPLLGCRAAAGAAGGRSLSPRAEEAVACCDENTIGVAAILGSTFDGSYEPVKEIAETSTIPVRPGLGPPDPLDAASGGFVAPFLNPPPRLPRNESSKSTPRGTSTAWLSGAGWAIGGTSSAPHDLIFDVNYLGGHMPTLP